MKRFVMFLCLMLVGAGLAFGQVAGDIIRDCNACPEMLLLPAVAGGDGS